MVIQTNEYNTSSGSRVRTVNVVELLESLYGSSKPHSVGLTRARKIATEDKKGLTDIIRKLGIQEPINF